MVTTTLEGGEFIARSGDLPEELYLHKHGNEVHGW